MPKVKVWHRTFESFNTLDVSVGTNCPQEGDAGHGGRTVFRVVNDAGTAMWGSINGEPLRETDTFTLILGGDSECQTFTDALEFGADTLKKQQIDNGRRAYGAVEETEEEIPYWPDRPENK